MKAPQDLHPDEDFLPPLCRHPRVSAPSFFYARLRARMERERMTHKWVPPWKLALVGFAAALLLASNIWAWRQVPGQNSLATVEGILGNPGFNLYATQK